MLKNKTVLLGVSGGIAAYKTAGLASGLVKLGADVHVIMTQNACNFISPITFETLTANKCITDTFDRNFEFKIEHVSLAKKADLCMIAPATANIIGKLACGIADDMLTTTVLACKCPILISPAMNTRMYENPIVADNMEKLKHYGFKVIPPAGGRLACGDTGMGKMPEAEELLEYILYEITYEKDLTGKHILVTAGATREDIDPVRFISNRSTGKMGIELARAASMRGAEVTLILGTAHLRPPRFITCIPVHSALDMFNAVKKIYEKQDIIIKAAAVADYKPKRVAVQKIKKGTEDANLELAGTDDILGFLGANKKQGQFLCGFSMETENVIENSRAKLHKKNLDMIAANNLKEEGAGFSVDTNIVTLITPSYEKKLELMTKGELSHKILDEIKNRIKTD